MSLHAYVSYTNASSVDSTGASIEIWGASIRLREPNAGLALSQSQPGWMPRESKPPLVDSLTVRANSLDEARAFALAAIEELTGIAPLLARSVDLRHLNASPAVVEEFKVAKDARKVA